MKGSVGVSMQNGNGFGRGLSPRNHRLNGPTVRRARQILEAVELGRAILTEKEASIVRNAASYDWLYTMTHGMRHAVWGIWVSLAEKSALRGCTGNRKTDSK